MAAIEYNSLQRLAFTIKIVVFQCTVDHKSHDPSFHKKYIESGVMTFVAHCTVQSVPNSVKTKPHFGECFTCFGYETKTRIAYFGNF